MLPPRDICEQMNLQNVEQDGYHPKTIRLRDWQMHKNKNFYNGLMVTRKGSCQRFEPVKMHGCLFSFD